MAREIFIVDASVDEGDAANKHADVVFWLTAPTNRVRPNPTANPGIPPDTAVSWGYTTAELTAIRAGTVLVVTHTIAAGEITPPVNLVNFQAAADALFTRFQNALTASALAIKTVGMARSGGVWGAAP